MLRKVTLLLLNMKRAAQLDAIMLLKLMSGLNTEDEANELIAKALECNCYNIIDKPNMEMHCSDPETDLVEYAFNIYQHVGDDGDDLVYFEHRSLMVGDVILFEDEEGNKNLYLIKASGSLKLNINTNVLC